MSLYKLFNRGCSSSYTASCSCSEFCSRVYLDEFVPEGCFFANHIEKL